MKLYDPENPTLLAASDSDDERLAIGMRESLRHYEQSPRVDDMSRPSDHRKKSQPSTGYSVSHGYYAFFDCSIVVTHNLVRVHDFVQIFAEFLEMKIGLGLIHGTREILFMFKAVYKGFRIALSVFGMAIT